MTFIGGLLAKNCAPICTNLQAFKSRALFQLFFSLPKVTPYATTKKTVVIAENSLCVSSSRLLLQMKAANIQLITKSKEERGRTELLSQFHFAHRQWHSLSLPISISCHISPAIYSTISIRIRISSPIYGYSQTWWLSAMQSLSR